MIARSKNYLLALALVFLTACSSVGVQMPDTFNAKLAVAVATVTEVRQTATTLLVAQKIGVDDAKNVQAQADNARAGLDIARTLAVTDVSTASAKLDAVSVGLNALRTYLITKGATK